MSDFDSIHDIKATRDHLVFCDLPFKMEPQVLRGTGPRAIPNQDITQLWIVAKDDLRRTPPGEPVKAIEVHIPIPSGHLTVDVDDDDGILRVHLEHIALADLMITLAEGDTTHAGEVVGADHEGLISLTQQPGCMGTYEIVAATGEVRAAEKLWDDRFWGGVLSTYDYSSAEARDRVTQAWYSGMGFDPALVSQEWWDLYEDTDNEHFVPLEELPVDGRPGAVAHFDLESKKVVGVYEYTEPGAFPSPPTFVPRRDPQRPQRRLRHGPRASWIATGRRGQGDPDLRRPGHRTRPAGACHGNRLQPATAVALVLDGGARRPTSQRLPGVTHP